MTQPGTGARRAKDLFHQALELEAQERRAFVRRQCAGDEVLGGEVESLLLSYEEAGDFLDVPARETLESIWLGRSIGEYEIVRMLGRGGIGLVFEAHQARPRRAVALKLLRPELVSESVIKRFELEAELLGRLQHPGIAQVFEAGAIDTEFGRQPYLAMEKIDGRPLLRHALDLDLDRGARMELVARVCDAVHHAHQRGVIHRDLKPSNILVDARGQPKVLDFGVARATNADFATVTLQTQVGQLVGTVSYMSPEQAEGGLIELDARTDVYSLGVILFQLLAGRLPHDLRGKPLAEAVRILREEPPASLHEAVPDLRSDAVTIVETALSRERERRYATAADLAEDIRRFLDNAPIRARPASTFYQLRQFARRNRALVGGVAATVTALLVGIAVTTAGQIREKGLREQAESATTRAEAAQLESEVEAYRANLMAAESFLIGEDVPEARARLEASRSGPVGWEWTHVRRRLDRSESLWSHGTGIQSMQISPDGVYVATGGLDGKAKLWKRETGELVWETLVSESSGVRGLTFSPDGRTLALSAGFWRRDRARSGSIRLWSVATGKQLGEPFRGHAEATQRLSFHPTRPVLVSASSDATIRVWDLASRETLHVLEQGHEVRQIEFSPDGTELASVAFDGCLRVFDASSWELALTVRTREPMLIALAWSPDGARIAVGDHAGEIRVFERASGRLLSTMRGHRLRVDELVFSPDGRRLYSASNGGTLRSWDAADGRELGVFLGSKEAITAVALEPGAQTLLSAGLDGVVRRWSTDTRDITKLSGFSGDVRSTKFSPDGRWIASTTTGWYFGVTRSGSDGMSSISVHDAATHRLHRRLVGHGQQHIWSVRFSPDSRCIVSAAEDGRVVLWDVEAARAIHDWEHPERVRRAEFSHDGSLVATTCWDGSVRLFDAESGELSKELVHPHRPFAVAFSPDDRWLVTTHYGGHVARWRVAEGTLEETYENVHTNDAYVAAFAPDGSLLVTAGKDGLIQRWDPERFVPEGQTRHSLAIYDVAFSADGTRLAACGRRGTLRLWDTHLWKEVASLRGHVGDALSVDFSPDGRWIVTGGYDRTLLLWDGGSEAERLVDRWMGELPLTEDVIERLRANTDIPADIRDRALELARSRLLEETRPAPDYD